MKKIIFLLLCSLLFIQSKSQAPNPVSWMATYKSINAKEGEIIITAIISKNWHTYSQRPTDAGPISTAIHFTPSKQYELVGKTEETNAHEEYDKAFEAKIFVFTDNAEFKQKIKLKSKPGFSIPFTVEFVCCSDMMCQPPKTVELNVKAQ